MLCTWLSERLDHSLHLYQCTCLAHIVKKIYSDFELQGVIEEKLNSTTYQTIFKRMQTEEATCALTSVQNEEWVLVIWSNNDTYSKRKRYDRVVQSCSPLLYRGLSENGNDDEVERPKPKVTVVETVNSEDANLISNVTSNVVEKVGSMFGKGIGGLSTKFGGPSWFWSFFLLRLVLLLILISPSVSSFFLHTLLIFSIIMIVSILVIRCYVIYISLSIITVNSYYWYFSFLLSLTIYFRYYCSYYYF